MRNKVKFPSLWDMDLDALSPVQRAEAASTCLSRIMLAWNDEYIAAIDAEDGARPVDDDWYARINEWTELLIELRSEIDTECKALKKGNTLSR